MKSLAFFCALMAVMITAEESTYEDLENFNAQEVVDNLDLLKSYGECFLGREPCSPEAEKMKKAIPNAIKDNCSKCTPKHKEQIRIMGQALKAQFPDLWQEIQQLHDPEGKYKDALRAILTSSN